MRLSVFFAALLLFLLPITFFGSTTSALPPFPEGPSVGIIEGIIDITLSLLKSFVCLNAFLLIMPCPLGLLLVLYGFVWSAFCEHDLRPFRDTVNAYVSLSKSHPVLFLPLTLLFFTIPIGFLFVISLSAGLFTKIASFLKPETTVHVETFPQGETIPDWISELLGLAKTIVDIVSFLLPFFFIASILGLPTKSLS